MNDIPNPTTQITEEQSIGDTHPEICAQSSCTSFCCWFSLVVRCVFFSKSSYPIGPMGLVYSYTYIWLIFMVNVGEYAIHGSYGYKHPSMHSYSQLMIGCPFARPKRIAFRCHETILQKVIGFCRE